MMNLAQSIRTGIAQKVTKTQDAKNALASKLADGVGENITRQLDQAVKKGQNPYPGFHQGGTAPPSRVPDAAKFTLNLMQLDEAPLEAQEQRAFDADHVRAATQDATRKLFAENGYEVLSLDISETGSMNIAIRDPEFVKEFGKDAPKRDGFNETFQATA